MRSISSFIYKPLFLSILSGIFIGTSYIPFIPWALLFCFTPLWYVWIFKRLSAWKVFFYGWITQFVFTLIGFHWISYTAMEYGKLPFILSILILFLFCATQNLHIPLTGLLWHYVHKKTIFSPQASLFFLAIATAFLERLYPMLFYWNLGYPWLWIRWPIYQWADTIGFEGLSTLTCIFNAYLFFIFILIQKNRKKSPKDVITVFQYFMALLKNYKAAFSHIIIFTVLFILLNITGKIKQNAILTDQTFHVGAIQANIGNFDKHQSYRKRSFYPVIYEQYFNLTESLLNQLTINNLDLIIWPETAFPGRLDAEIYDVHKYQLKQFILKHKTPLLTGAYSGNRNDTNYYNALFFFNNNGQLLERYRKSYLLAFGEYFPGSGLFPFLKNWFPQVSHFSAGQGPQTFVWKDIILGMQICYEGLDPHFSVSLAKQNAHIIVNVTNDSWFGHTYEPYQHLYMTLARAIEIRRPLVRVTNTGITAAILADGTLLEQGPQQRTWTKHFTISYTQKPSLTLFARFGQYIPFLQIALLVLIVTISIIVKKH